MQGERRQCSIQTRIYSWREKDEETDTRGTFSSFLVRPIVCGCHHNNLTKGHQKQVRSVRNAQERVKKEGMSFSSRRRNYLLTPHRRDGLIEW